MEYLIITIIIALALLYIIFQTTPRGGCSKEYCSGNCSGNKIGNEKSTGCGCKTGKGCNCHG